MKNLAGAVTATAVLALLIIGNNHLRAQSLPQAQAQSILSQTQLLQSADDLSVMLQAVEMTTPASASSLPDYGTFWSAQHAPGSDSEWPPLPSNINQLPVWNLGGNAYILDDTNFDYDAQIIAPRMATSKSGGIGLTMDAGSPPVPPGGGTNSGGISPHGVSAPINYGTNLCFIQVGLTNNGMSTMTSNTIADVLYEIQTNSDLTTTNWGSFGFFFGSEITNFTPLDVIPANLTSNLFFRIRSWVDSTGTGIPDWWWLEYFGQITNVDAYVAAPAGDGYTDLQKYEMGLNPNIYYNPNSVGGFFGSLDATGTNVVLEWSNAPGPVVNYLIQRGIYNAGTSTYNYTPILVSSNATFFKDTGIVTNANAQNDIYTLAAVYPGSMSATNTWEISWYADYSGYGPPYNPPTPNNVYAYLDATGTNVILTWLPAQGPATNQIIARGVYNPTNNVFNYSQIAQTNNSIASLVFTGVVTNTNSWNVEYGVTAVYPGGGLSLMATSCINIGSTNGPAAPDDFYGYADSTGTNIYLSWTAATGAVTNYIVYGGVWNNNISSYQYTPIGKIGSSTNFFEVRGALDGSGNYLYSIYGLVAVYTNNGLSQAATWTPGFGAPAPGALYAWLDSTRTNVQLSWSAATGTITGYLVQRSDDGVEYPWSFYEVGQVSSNTTSLEDVDAVDTGAFDPSVTVYEVQAMYPNGGLSSAVTAMVSNTPAAPPGFSASVDSTGTNVVLAWTPALGNVVNYVIERGILNTNTGTYSYSQIGEVSSGTTSFEDDGAITGPNSYNNVYEIAAIYAGGASSGFEAMNLPSPPPISIPSSYNIHVGAQLVRGSNGRWQVVFSYIPPNVQSFQFYWAVYSYDADVDVGYITQSVTLSSVSNNIYAVPDSNTTNAVFDGIYANDYAQHLYVQAIETNGNGGTLGDAGFLYNDAPWFVNGQQHLKQNLLFKLRAATMSQPCTVSDEAVDPYGEYETFTVPADTNYVESSLYHWAIQFKEYGNWEPTYIKLSALWPFEVNYQLHQLLYDPSHPEVPSSFVWSNDDVTVPAPAVLGISDPYWILQDFGDLPDVAAYTNSVNLFLNSGSKNLFGLSFKTALVNTNPETTLALGSSIALTNVSGFYSQTADPVLQTNGYYFSIVNTPGTTLLGDISEDQNQPSPIPANTGFASTNQTGLMIASVGNPTFVGGWEKFSVSGSSPTKYAYLGQYFVTNAILLGANGNVTTNSAGIVSPYGEFFPTQGGQAQFITTPDIDPPYEQGTCTVAIVSMNVDANHDGTMDLSYFGPDQTSSSRPFRFWVNDDTDWGDDTGDGIPGQGAQGDGMSQIYNATSVPYQMVPSFTGVWEIHGRRDLVDYFPVYLNIGSLFQSNAVSSGISVTDTNYQFILSQADGALRFASTDLTPTNYMNFLRDTNESGNLQYALLTTITSNGVALSSPVLGGIASSNQGIILVEAWTNTTRPLVLTIYHGTNQIAQTQVYLSMSGVEQMFRSKTILLDPDPRAVPDRLTDAKVPNEPDTTGMNFVFLHGYNVNPQQARGWNADFYKRMYWSGSHAKFYGVTWEGSDSQFAGQVTFNLQTNIVHAINTAPLLSSFLNSLPGTNVLAGHSLGNIVVLSTLNDYTNQAINTYFMIDAAVAVEALDGNATPNANMYWPAWIAYADKLNASHWWQLWPTNDARSTLTWNNRFANLQNAEVYNFYSSGEEVLREYTGGYPPSELTGSANEVEYYLLTTLVNQGLPAGAYTWAWQELLKGHGAYNWLLSSSHGGWKFNTNAPYTYITNGVLTQITNSQATLLPNSELQTNAFFDVTSTNFGNADLALFGTNGNAYAQANRNRIISDAIPCLTLPVGANPVTKLDTEFGGQHNFNMDTNTFENGWPAVRLQNSTETSNWHHSDCRQVAYTFTHNLFDDMATFGGLK